MGEKEVKFVKRYGVKSISLLLAMCVLLSSCGVGNSPEKTVDNLEAALHRADFDGVLECFEPHVGQGIRAVAKLTGGLIGFDGEAVLELLPLFVDIIAITDSAGNYDEIEKQLKSIQLNVTGVAYNDDGNEATATVEVSAGGAKEIENMELVKKDGEWYIKMR